MSYVTSVGGDPINPIPFNYSQISMTGNIDLVWPINNQNATYTATNWIDITSSAAYTATMPSAVEVGEGAESVFYNYGSYTITINDSTGGNITTVAAGATKRIWVTDNSTAAGSWRVANIGSGTTNADASALAGYGLVAQAGTLSQSMPPLSYSTTSTLNAGNRAALSIWTGGAGTFTLTNPATLGSNWFTGIKNSGSGTLTVDGSGALVDGSPTISVGVNESFLLETDGSAFYTVGRLTPNTSSITQLSKSVAGSGTIVLTSAETAYNIINLTGILTGNKSVEVPANVNEWLMYNNTTGAYTLTVKTNLGTGVEIVQSSRRLVYCDGSDVFYQDSVSGGSVSSVATGTGLSGGPITTTGTISLANTAVVAGNYTVPNITVDAQGRLTSAANATTLQTPTTSGSTLTIRAYDVDGTTYTTFATLTAGNTPTMDLSTAVTQGGAVIYRVGGTDVAVADGGTGLSTLTANNVILGNGTSSPTFVAPSTSGNLLTSNGTTWVSSALTASVAQGGTGRVTLTANYVLLGNGTTAVQMIAPSTSGNILTSNGTTWASSAPPSSGAMVYLGTQTASTSATLDFTSLITSSYDVYVFEIIDIKPATNGANFWLRTSTDNGSNWDSGSNNYYSRTETGDIDASPTGASISGGTATGTTAAAIALSVLNGSSDGLCGTLTLWNPLGTTRKKSFHFEGQLDDGSGTMSYVESRGFRNSTADVDAVRFLFASGNITSGKIAMYGIKNS